MDNGNEFIRIAEISDKETLAVVGQLAARIFPETYRELLAPEQIPYMMEMMYSPAVLRQELDNLVHFALIYDGETPIGYISWHDAAEAGEKLIKLEKLYLDFAYHGRGIGNLALNFVLDTARQTSANAVILNVNKQNSRAQRAYRRAGFAVWRSEVNPIGNGYVMDDYVMRHDLEPLPEN